MVHPEAQFLTCKTKDAERKSPEVTWGGGEGQGRGLPEATSSVPWDG